MTSESKILTVSYGTFSCTLEGFEDPFNTMKAIAEYFRDLAADDRYFGAEPPQPDAAMLHRIAEREVSRIVDSRVGDNAVTLRPQSQAAGAASTPAARVMTQPRPSPDAGAGDEATPEPTLQDVIPTGVAAKLARIRQSVNPPFVPASVAEAALDALASSDDLAAAEDLAAPASATTEALDAEASVETARSANEIEAEAGDVLSRLDALMTDPSADEVAEDLEAEAEIDNAFGDVFEADAAPMLEDASPEDIALEDIALEGMAPEEPAPAELVAEAADYQVAHAGTVAADEAVGEPVAEEVADEPADSVVAAQVDSWLMRTRSDFEVEAEVEAAPETILDAAADILATEHAQTDDAQVDLMATEETPVEEMLAEDAAALLADDSLPEDAPADDLTLTEALAADPLPEEAPVATSEPELREPEAAAASPLKSKTKRVSSRVVRIHPDDDGDIKPDANATRVLDGSQDDDFARLLRQADDVMSDEDNRRRLDSIAHLKAAVAATEADRAAGTETKPAPGTKQEPYRDDLSKAVQPDPEPAPAPEVKPRRKTISVRPQEPRPGTIRPGMVSPPPLVLVSEQRIDRVPPPAPAYTPPPAAAYSPQPDGQPMVALRTGRLTGAIGAAAASPVSPHQKLVLEQRAAAVDPEDEEDLNDELSPADEAGLLRFAEQVGVKSMADMLEAAAAYATCVESRSQFTRPQLMRRLMATAGGKPVSREDGLRSFGTLLRTGRIEKVSRGHYVLAEHSPYLAEARRLG
jgi:hypothetical protein